MTFPTQGVLDAFNRSNEDLTTSGNWDGEITSFHNDIIKIVSNQCKITSSFDGSAHWVAATFTDSEVFLTIVTRQDVDDAHHIYARLQGGLGSSSVDGYVLEYRLKSGTDEIKIMRMDNETFFVIGATISQDVADGEKLGLEVNGTSDELTAYHFTGGSWGSIGNRDDGTYTAAGNIGFDEEDTTIVIDDFGGGEIGVAGGLIAPPLLHSFARNRAASY